MDQNTRGPRRARGSVSRNRVGNWQVRYTDPHGVRRAAGTFQRKADAEQALARVLTAIENNTWAVLDDTAGDGLDPKTVTLRELTDQQPENTRLRAALRQLDKQLVSNLSLLGFTPSDRSRSGLVEVKAKTKLEELMERRASRDERLREHPGS